jgi:hypothetical protein
MFDVLDRWRADDQIFAAWIDLKSPSCRKVRRSQECDRLVE